MGLIPKETNPELFQRLTINNLKRQFDLLRDMTSVGLQIKNIRIDKHIICALHSITSVYLVTDPGRYREDEAHITGSEHTPPTPEKIDRLMIDYIQEIHRRWDKDDKFILAAFVLWRILWIHPFEDGNGRTARALAYLTICLRHERWLPGSKTILQLIKEHPEEYLRAVRIADTTHATGEAELTELAVLLARFLKTQLESAAPSEQVG
jgi:Fic family protein